MKSIIAIFSFFILSGLISGAMSINASLVLGALGIALAYYEYNPKEQTLINPIELSINKKQS